MTQTIPISDLFPTPAKPVEVEIFDPPMCCSSGICGPTLVQTLMVLNEMILTLQGENVQVARYQMTSHPNAFLGNTEVMNLIREKQMEALPITVVRGKVIKTSEYPTLTEIKTNLNGAA